MAVTSSSSSSSKLECPHGVHRTAHGQCVLPRTMCVQELALGVLEAVQGQCDEEADEDASGDEEKGDERLEPVDSANRAEHSPTSAAALSAAAPSGPSKPLISELNESEAAAA